MRRKFLLTGACLAVGIVTACSTPETVIKTEDIPTGGVRFINAVPDTAGALGLDFRFYDLVESNAHFRITFRNGPSGTPPVSAQTQYKGARAGARKFRVFLDDTITTITSTVLKDSTITVEALHNYTAMLWGNARSTGADKMKLTVWDETVPAPTGTNIALRIVNTQSTPINVRVYAQGGTAPATATWANVPAYSASSYVTLPAGNYLYNVRGADDGANLFTDAQALVGAAATVDIEAIPGTAVAGSAISGFVFPRSVAGSKAPQGGAFGAPAITFNWDKRPPRTCSPLC